MASTYEAAVRTLLSEQGARLPDLSGVTLLVPHHHCLPAFLAECRRQLAVPVFLPPRLATLPALAAGQAGVQTDSQRLAALYGWLSGVAWLDEAARWPLAQALLDLLHELDDARLAPPADYADFAAQVERAVRRGLGRPMEQEARLVHEVWRAFNAAGPGSRGGYALGLAAWRDGAAGPLYSLGLAGLSALEQHFLAECRERLNLRELPVTEPWPDRRAWLDLMLNPGPEAAPLPERARACRTAWPESPLALDLVGAADMEAEAGAAAVHIKAWLAEGRRTIAVIALDRLAARRLRAVLERDRILVQDETGWTFATATVSHVLDRWFALLQDGCYHRDLLDLLKSPYVFADVPADRRLAAVAALERQIARHQVVAGWERFLALATGEAADARPLLERLVEAAQLFRKGERHSLAGWLAVLFQALDGIGASPAWAADQAGRQLLDLLHRLAGELAGDRARYGLARWRGWLNLQLDRATFVADDIDSPIRLTHLAAARLRDFDAVVVLGADAAHLPAAAGAELFSDAVRLQLGLPGQRQRREETLADLIEVLARSGRALITWRAWQGTEPNPRSPWLDLLAAGHRLAYGDDLTHMVAVALPVVESWPEAAPARLAAAPARLSASAWQALVDCPYRYFARYGLGLGEPEEVAEAMAKADYGERVHEILRRFHAEHPVLAEHAPERLAEALLRLGRAVFQASERDDYLAMAWRLRWERHCPAYLGWALAREAAGWRWQAAEAARECPLVLPDGGVVTLYGRLDRLDEGPDGLAVLDYKTQGRTVLRARLKVPGEDVQLAFYGLLTGAARAGLVALDDERVDVAEMQRPLAEAAAAEAVRLAEALAAVAAGAPLPAQGDPETCRWCEMRGLCRRR